MSSQANSLNNTIQSKPQENRSLSRESVPLEDHFQIEVSFKDEAGNKIFKKFTVKNIHCSGAMIEGEIPTTDHNGRKGMILSDVNLLYCDSIIGRYENAVVCHSANGYSGIYFLQGNSQGPALYVNRREQVRVEIIPHFRPQASASHPFKYDTQVLFQVHDISLGGMRVSTSLRNKMIFRGSRLVPILVHTGGGNTLELQCEVVYVTPDPKSQQLYLGLKFLSLPDQATQAELIKFLLSYGVFQSEDPLKWMKAAGFKPKSIKGQFDFSFAHSLEEYQAVLDLRLAAYSRAGKIGEITDRSKMADVFDLNSRIVIAKYRGKVIGSVRLTTCSQPNDRYELEDSIKIPSKYKRHETVEISRLCVDDSAQGSDLVLGLIERCTEYCAKMGIRYVITSCVEEMLDYYKKIAFYPTGLKFTLSTLNGIPHYFLSHDCKHHRFAKNINPLAWHFAYRRMLEHLSRFQKYQNYSNVGPLKRGLILFGIALLKAVQKLKRRSPRKPQNSQNSETTYPHKADT